MALDFRHTQTFIIHPQSCFEVEVLGDNMDRDAVKQNIPVLRMAANLCGLRVGVRACTVHVQALYDYMQVPCPRSFGRTCHMNICRCAKNTTQTIYAYAIYPSI